MKAEMDFGIGTRMASNLESQERTIRNILSELNSVYSDLSRNQTLFQHFKTQLANTFGYIESLCAIIKSFATAANETVVEYSRCEQKVAGKEISFAEVGRRVVLNAAMDDPNLENNSFAGEDRKLIDVGWKDLFSFAGEFGVVGGIVSAAYSIHDDPKNVGKAGTKIVGIAAKVAKKVVSGKEIDTFGFHETVDAIGFRENLAKNLEGYKINSSYNANNSSIAIKNANNIGAVAKWAGVAISGMLSFAENVEEFDADFSNPRLYAETVTETTVDTGLGIIVGAGVAALAGATAPAWAVGIVASGAVMGLNLISEAVFDKDVGELVTDIALDATEAVAKYAKKASTIVGKAVKGTAKKAKAAWNKIKSIF